MHLFPDPLREWHEAEAELEVMLLAKQRGERFDGDLEEARLRAAEARTRAQGGIGASGPTASGN